MSSIRKTSGVFVLFFVLAISASHAQLKTSKYEIGINLGTLVYQGDLTGRLIGNYKPVRPALGLYVSRSLDSYFSVRASLTLGKISADEYNNYDSSSWHKYRGFNFSTPVTELAASLVFHPFGENGERKLSPYLFAGGGVTFLNVKRDWSKLNKVAYDEKSKVQIGLGTDTLYNTPRTIAILPVGGGLRYVLSPQLAVNGEFTYRFTATDYLDGFKYSGNENSRDGYYGVSIGLSYRFGGYKCPSVRQ
ncbi:MAG: thrombospondin type 3 repeat-containing protein [Segetibacter sp.]|jgi:OOP family OmpA-OmpF porin|nr:thrombospondin type 3 repeat-containing protein [Segetibacter sp.]